MTAAAEPALPLPDDDPPDPADRLAWEDFAHAPLVPVAVAVTAGLVADRYFAVPFHSSLLAAAGGIVGWVVLRSRNPPAAIVCLWLAFAGLAAAYHHDRRSVFPADDIGHFAADRPTLCHVRGVIDEPPLVVKPHTTDLLGPTRRPDRGVTVLAVREVQAVDGDWRPASGRARLTVDRVVAAGEPGLFDTVRIGDEVDVIGLLARPAEPANPGGWDFADRLLDDRIRAEVRVTKSADGVARLAGGSPWSAGRLLTAARGYAVRLIDDSLPPREAALARALLLGDGSAMDRAEWDRFVRTGVVHVLAISGQHLVILAGFGWVALRLAGVYRRRGAWLVAAGLVGYAVLTGLRPSALRAAVMVCAACGGIVLRRPVSAANTLALAWLAVALLDPTDVFSTGCLLSFVAVAVLVWGAGRWLARRPKPPLDRLIDESRPAWVRLLRAAGRAVFVAYAVTAVLTLATAPLIADRQNLVSPVGLLIGPPLVLLTTVALLAGFGMLVAGVVGTWPAVPFAAVTAAALAGCDRIVRWADGLPGGVLYVPGPPAWWLVGFYLLLVVALLLEAKWQRRLLVGLGGWLLLGLVGLLRTVPDGLRVTFLSVGHGGCTVLETPDGRVLLYDAGTMAGADVVRRVIAPFLWCRRVRRVDELFLSHADLDHYNGVPELLRRFPVGQVTLTPSFADKPAAEVAEVLEALRRTKTPRRIAVAGDRFAAGAVEIDVLHPPPDGPPGIENERSLVLLVKHAGHAVLLTGDLEKAGTSRVLDLPPPAVDVLMAPHHGSRTAYPPAFARWARPGLVVVSRGGRDASGVGKESVNPEAEVWDTWAHGAVTVTSHPTGLTAETFRTREALSPAKTPRIP